MVVWTTGDPNVIPIGLRSIAADAQVQQPFALPFRRGERILTVGWAILRPQPAFARADYATARMTSVLGYQGRCLVLHSWSIS